MNQAIKNSHGTKKNGCVGKMSGNVEANNLLNYAELFAYVIN